MKYVQETWCRVFDGVGDVSDVIAVVVCYLDCEASSLVALLGRGSFSQVGGLVDVISRRKAEIGSQPRVRRCALVSRVRLQDLDDSRKIKLLKALVQGRRKCNVKELAIQLRVDRKTLLEWFKVYARDPATIANHLN
eukprot:626069-Amorphochlora_amoeboformis.AAC.1